MKKSELVDQLKNFYNEHFADEEPMRREEASAMIDFLVGKGMMPPCRAGFGGHGKLDARSSCDDYVESCYHWWDHESS